MKPTILIRSGLLALVLFMFVRTPAALTLGKGLPPPAQLQEWIAQVEAQVGLEAETKAARIEPLRAAVGFAEQAAGGRGDRSTSPGGGGLGKIAGDAARRTEIAARRCRDGGSAR